MRDLVKKRLVVISSYKLLFRKPHIITQNCVLAPPFKPANLIIIGLPVRATQSRKMEATSSVQQNDKMADGIPRRLCVSHSPFNGADFWEETGHFRSSCETIWESNSKLLHLVIGNISTPNDYLNTEFDDVVSL